jgi:hypothetical protein
MVGGATDGSRLVASFTLAAQFAAVSQQRLQLGAAKSCVLALNYQLVTAATGVHRNVAFRVRLPPAS